MSARGTVALPNIGIDTGRHLLGGGGDVAAIRAVLAGPANSLANAPAVAPLLNLAATKLGHVATATLRAGSDACVRLTRLVGWPRANPAVLAAVRKYFTGTFTPPQAELTALANPTDTTALDALTFADQATAQANQAGRSAAVAEVTMMVGEPN